MKIKVGIMSMQRIYNYGSFLQAYGLKKILEELECDVEFVDYHLKECLIPTDGGEGIFRKIRKAIIIFKGNAPIREKIRCIKYKKNYASNYYSYLGISRTMNFTPKLDLLVIGSDEVFNCVQNNVNVGFSPELFGENNHAKRLITYAASFGNTTVSKLEQYQVREKVADWLRKFDVISVRDNNSRVIVETLTGKCPIINFDPVLVYDFVGKCKDIPFTVPKSKYMILYGYSGRFSKEECKKIRACAEQRHLKIFCIGGVQDCCDKFIDCLPFQVINYFQHADCVITDTFHGTILSVITHQKFASFVRSSGYGNSEKLTDLLYRLNLSIRMVKKMERLEHMLDTPIDYGEVDQIIERERLRTYKYLEEQLQKL